MIAVLLSAALAPRAQGQASTYEQLQTFSSLINQVRMSYVDTVTYAQLVHAAINGVLSSLDPHSRFESRTMAERELAYQSGKLGGTGIVLEDVDGALTVLSLLPNSPAARAGISPGDRLLSIDDTTVDGLSSYEASSRLLGDKGRKIQLLFERGPRLGPDTVQVRIKCDFLAPSSVGAVRLVTPATGYIELTGFNFKGGDEVEHAVKDLQGRGATQLLLDLRGNPGGFVPEAVEIAALFLPEQTLVFRVEGRGGRVLDFDRTQRSGPFRDLPLILLIDQSTASAAEAFAASLQDHDRALVLGRRSFGKALIQQAFPIPPQGDLVWLTVGRVISPSGRLIQRAYRGLRPGQYYSFAGRTGAAADTTEVFHTDHGRPVRGGGGIAPDVPLPRTADLPVWFTIAADSGWPEAVSDSVAGELGKDAGARSRWLEAREEWQRQLVEPFLLRVRSRLGVTAHVDSALAARLGRILAYRVAEVRWGPEGGDEFRTRNDPDIQAAMAYWPRLSELLAGDGRKLQ